MKRVFLLVLIVGFVVFVSATGCLGQETLTVIGPWSGAERDAFLPVLEAFEKETGINVEYRAYRADDLVTLLPAQLEAEMAPGDVIFMWGWFVTEKAQEGHVLEVTDIINEDDFMPGALDSLKVGEKLYGAVTTGKAKPGFWYRKSFFEKHNLTPPNTWKEFLALLEKIDQIPDIETPIVSGDGVGWPLSDATEHFLVAFGGPQLHKDLVAGEISWTDPLVKAIFGARLVPLLEAGYFSEPIEWTQALQLWWDGDYGLYFMGSWITGMVEDPNDLDVFSLPGATGLVYGADGCFIPTYTKYPEEAKQFVKFLTSEKGQEIQVAQGGHIASHLNVPLDAYPPVDREVAEAMKGKEVLSDMDDTIGGEFQTTFWDQLKLLWVKPDRLDDVLEMFDEKAP